MWQFQVKTHLSRRLSGSYHLQDAAGVVEPLGVVAVEEGEVEEEEFQLSMEVEEEEEEEEELCLEEEELSLEEEEPQRWEAEDQWKGAEPQGFHLNRLLLLSGNNETFITSIKAQDIIVFYQ